MSYRHTREEVDAALRAQGNDEIFVPGTNGMPAASVLAAEVQALRDENAELRRQLVAARSALQQCTHERVDPNRDAFGGMGT